MSTKLTSSGRLSSHRPSSRNTSVPYTRNSSSAGDNTTTSRGSMTTAVRRTTDTSKCANAAFVATVEKKTILMRLEHTLSTMAKQFASQKQFSSDEYCWEMTESSMPDTVTHFCEPLIEDMIHHWPVICGRVDDFLLMTLNCKCPNPQFVIFSFVMVALAILQHEQVLHTTYLDLAKTTKIVVRREEEQWIDYGYGPMGKPGASTAAAFPDIYRPTWCYGIALSQKTVDELLRTQTPSGGVCK